VVVTGAVGFIGRHLAAVLEAAGCEVLGVDNMSAQPLQPYPGSCLLVRDVHDLSRGDIAGAGMIVHLASAKNVPRSFGEPHLYAANASMAVHLLALAHRVGVPRVVIGSTCEVYGDQGDGPLSEQNPVVPRSPYAASKASMEMVTRVYQLANPDTNCPRTTIVRFFNVYGPGERADALIPSLCHAGLTRGFLSIEGSGRQRRDFTYIDDAVADLVAAIDRGLDVVNLGGGQTASVLQVAELVRGHLGGPPLTRYPQRPNEIASFQSNRTLGVDARRHRIGLGEGIARTVAWWRERLAVDPRFGETDSVAAHPHDTPTEERDHACS
jgi:dTDP-glucose 4,6-dehydratase/UDP-glucose 4-epimerase